SVPAFLQAASLTNCASPRSHAGEMVAHCGGSIGSGSGSGPGSVGSGFCCVRSTPATRPLHPTTVASDVAAMTATASRGVVEDAVLAGRRGAARLLEEERHRVRFVEETQLAVLALRICGVPEHAALDERAMCIGDERSDVARAVRRLERLAAVGVRADRRAS